MNKPITIYELEKFCAEEILRGNGKKAIMISSDDEGNNYHYLWYGFTTIKQMEEPIKLGNKVYECPFEFADERIAKKEDTIILG
jgi:hypothetical protein